MIAHHGRRDFLKLGAVAICGATTLGRLAKAAALDDRRDDPLDDPPSVHGMMVTGSRTIFLSHLPMFGSPHDYQVILEATFSKRGGDPQADYFADRERTGATLYTLEPERFVLPKLNARAPLRSFKASVYRGHFERFPTRAAKEEARIVENAEVTITRVIRFAKFDPSAAKSSQLEYLYFGKGDEFFLAHVISAPPDFDQIIPVLPLDHSFTEAELARGVSLVVPERENAAASRIAANESVKVVATSGDGTTFRVPLMAGVEVYFEEGELAS